MPHFVAPHLDIRLKKWAENEFDATDMQLRTEHRMLQDPNDGLEAIIQRAPVDAPDLSRSTCARATCARKRFKLEWREVSGA